MAIVTEDTDEQFALERVDELGYEILHGVDCSRVSGSGFVSCIPLTRKATNGAKLVQM